MKLTFEKGELREGFKDVASLKFIVKYWWLWCLVFIIIFSFHIRYIPSKYGELQALDPFYAYRMNVYMLEHNLQLPLHDDMRYWPDGVPIHRYGPLVYFYVPVILYLIFMFFGLSMAYIDFAIMYPALMGAISVFAIYWVGKEMFNDKKAGLFASIFLATVPAYLARTSAGFFDKEATGGTFLLFAVLFFIRSYKNNSWKYGILTGIFVFLAMGSWGGAQFIIYIISVFVIIKMLLNQYGESMIKSVIPGLIVAVLTQRYFLGVTGWPFEQILAIMTIGLIIIRFASERYRLVKEDQMHYLMPAVIVIIFLMVLIGSMFSDFLWNLLDRALGMIQLREKGHIGSTVAEQMPGDWNAIKDRLNLNYGRSIIPLQEPLTSLFSVWFLMLVAIPIIVYKLYMRREWMLLLPLIWLVLSIQTVFYMVRLVFFIGPPAALMAGYTCSVAIGLLWRTRFLREMKITEKPGIPAILITVVSVAVVTVLIFSNLATGFVFCSSVGPSFNQAWAESMNFLSENTPVNASILSWWDFGYWFQTRGNRPSTADGGNINGTVNEQIADWYVSDTRNWTDFRPWLEGKDVSYILMDYTLPGKYGAISKIASRGKTVVGMLQFQQNAAYPQGNKTVIEFKAGEYVIWVPVTDGGNIESPPIFMVSRGGQYIGRSYITDLCTVNGIVQMRVDEGQNIMPGCVAISSSGVFYVPEVAEHTIFTRLMFMDGFGIPDVEKVFDNKWIRIYKLDIKETEVPMESTAFNITTNSTEAG